MILQALTAISLQRSVKCKAFCKRFRVFGSVYCFVKKLKLLTIPAFFTEKSLQILIDDVYYNCKNKAYVFRHI